MKTFREYSFQDHTEVYRIIDKVVKSFDYKYYLIGANARDIQLYKAGLKPLRATADIDFAIMIPSMKDYSVFIKTLLVSGFKDTKQKYRVVYEKSDTVVDILPYGEIAEAYTLNFDERNIELSVLGFSEVGSDAEEFKIDDNFSIPTSPAHGLIILKLVAWNDNNERTKDLLDIRSILEAAWELYQDELYTENSPHFDLLAEKDFDIHNIAARIIGRKISPLLEQCEPLKSKVISILEKELANPSIMTLEMSRYNDSQIVLKLLGNLLQGIRDVR